MKPLLLLCLGVIISTSGLLAQAGTPDETFGGDGIVNTNQFAGLHATGNGILVQQNRKLLITVGVWSPNGSIGVGALIRYLEDGTLDEDFNGTGKVHIAYPDKYCSALTSVELPDGRILTLMHVYNDTTEMIGIHCFHADGEPDDSFGINGATLVQLPDHDLVPRTMEVDQDGRILIGGYASYSDGTNEAFMVVRLLQSGLRDTSFGDNGIVLTAVGEWYAGAVDILIRPDGKILATGYAILNGFEQFAVVRYTPSGALDNTFANSGIRIIPYGSYDTRLIGAALQADGKIVLGGYARFNNADADFAVMRLHENGTLDQSFHTDGMTTIAVSEHADGVRAILLQPDGKILLAGYAHSNIPGGSDMAIVRLMPNGTPDITFAENGVMTLATSPNTETISALSMQPDGKIVAAGYSRNGDYNGVVAVRIHSGITVRTNETTRPLSEVYLYPNPAQKHTTLEFALEQDESLSIRLLDVHGMHIAELMPQVDRRSGVHRETLKLPDHLPSGMYFIQLTTQHGMQAVTLQVL